MLRRRPDQLHLLVQLLHVLRICRKMGTRDVGASIHHTMCTRSGLPRQERGGTDGCSGGIWRFYSVGQPCRNLGQWVLLS